MCASPAAAPCPSAGSAGPGEQPVRPYNPVRCSTKWRAGGVLHVPALLLGARAWRGFPSAGPVTGSLVYSVSSGALLVVVLVSFISTLRSLGSAAGSLVAAEPHPASSKLGSSELWLLAGVNLRVWGINPSPLRLP